jgi:c(7)-type cytochrome triheme protein
MGKIMYFLVIILTLGFYGRVMANGEKDVLFVRSPAGPVLFSHDKHVRDQNLDCNQCHPTLYPTRGGSDPVTMSEMRDGKSCGACHNGKKAFRMLGDCSKCHKPRPS